MSVEIVTGDCREMLRAIAADTVACCVTSPPYFHLRDYGVAGQIGLEASIDEYVDEMVGVFREVRRVLQPDGTLWVNLGDSYNGAGKTGGATQKQITNAGSFVGGSPLAVEGLKPKDMCGIPWRVAFALQRDGWFLRSDIVWAKPNPMPSSVRDRPTKSHEYVFLLSRSERYFYDADAIAEPVAASTITRVSQSTLDRQAGSKRVPGKRNGPMKAVVRKQDALGKHTYTGCNERWRNADKKMVRNSRTVWTITTKPFKGAHFATMPVDLAERCILAGSRPGDVVLDPFGGAGTTALAAVKHGRRAVLIELNPEYAELARERLRAVQVGIDAA